MIKQPPRPDQPQLQQTCAVFLKSLVTFISSKPTSSNVTLVAGNIQMTRFTLTYTEKCLVAVWCFSVTQMKR